MKTKTFITADTHFGHANILKFNPATRQYTDADHMNAMMIADWNSKVGKDDTVYHLGDFAFLRADKAIAIARSLNGRKILVEGNHDHKLLNDPAFRACFEEVHKYHEITVLNTKVCLFHYQIAEWNQCHRGSVMLHGHSHGNAPRLTTRVTDVGMDATGNIVTEIESVVQEMLNRPNTQHH